MFFPVFAIADTGDSLIDATISGQLDKVEKLLEDGVDTEVHDWAGWTPLAWAALRLHDDIIRVLLAAGAEINVVARSGKNSGTPLMLASRRSHSTSTVLLLLASGAEVNGIDQYGRTALMMAARQGEIENIRLLLDAGGDPNVVANLAYNNTALKLARGGGHDDAVGLLLEAGAQD